MATTNTFYVSTKDNKLRKSQTSSREYFIKGGKKEGQAKYIIEVFGNNHQKVAKKIQKIIETAGMHNDLYLIKAEIK